jgi:hypothetical protein
MKLNERFYLAGIIRRVGVALALSQARVSFARPELQLVAAHFPGVCLVRGALLQRRPHVPHVLFRVNKPSVHDTRSDL